MKRAAPVCDVLIYYANETYLIPPARKNYEEVIRVLEADVGGLGPQVGMQIAFDLKAFPGSVNREVDIICSLFPRRNKLKVAVFTNELSTKGRMLVGDIDGLRSVPFAPQASSNYIARSAPNSLGGTLQSSLDAVARLFNPAEHDFTLIAKSHASARLLLVPRLTVRHEVAAPNEIVRLANVTDLGVGNNFIAQDVGTTAEEFFGILDDVGRRLSMKFGFVFAEVCEGRTTLNDALVMPTNVMMVGLPSVGLAYENIDYALALSSDDPIASIKQQILELLPHDIVSRARRSALELVLWWLPLISIIGVYLMLLACSS